MSAKQEKAKRRWQVTHNEPLIVGPEGLRASSETDDLPPMTMLYARAKIAELFPLDTPGTKEQKARRLYERHPLLAAAYRDGLRNGRDLRERSRRGLGWSWPTLMALDPKERGYVAAKVREAIGVEQ